MENFTNETIDTTQLPKFEAVEFTALHPKYWFVSLINVSMIILLIWAAVFGSAFIDEELARNRILLIMVAAVLTILILLFSRIAFLKKGFAFRTHDVLYRSGIISTNTIVIPYNRVQHVALHEGIVSRYFGLAEIAVFTAGGSSSDIGIPGIEKVQAENIKHLLMGKIQKQL